MVEEVGGGRSGRGVVEVGGGRSGRRWEEKRWDGREEGGGRRGNTGKRWRIVDLADTL